MNQIQINELSEKSSSYQEMELMQDKLCPVCQEFRSQFMFFECGHEFCKKCVVEFFIAQNPFAFNIDDVKCLQDGCHGELCAQDQISIQDVIGKPQSTLFIPMIDIHKLYGEIPEDACKNCRLVHPAQRFYFFGQSCESAEREMITRWAKEDPLYLFDDKDIQRCPGCGVWGSKEIGCNSVVCGYCQSNWCWLCRSKLTPQHFLPLNPLGCPGLGSDEHIRREWPYSRICYKRFKTCALQVCLFLLTVIFYPFFISYIVFGKIHLITRTMNFIRSATDKSCGQSLLAIFCRVTLITMFFLTLPLLYMITTIFSILPGIPLIICSKTFREFVFIS